MMTVKLSDLSKFEPESLVGSEAYVVPPSSVKEPNIISCECATCRTACRRKPGWFAPGEAELVAQHLGLSLKETFDKYLMVDWLAGGLEDADEDGDYEDQNIFLLSPAIVGGLPGDEFPANPNGQCVFFIEGKCSIHEVKPKECRVYDHRHRSLEVENTHEGIGKSWEKHQQQIKELLGREPIAAEYSPFDSFLW